MFKTILKNTYGLDINYDELRENNELFSDCDKLFETDSEIVGMKAMLTDFGPEELADVVDIAERLYEATGKYVFICIAMSHDRKVTVKEMTIKSEADFTIRLAIVDMHRIALEKVRENIAKGIQDDADRHVLEMMPMIVPAHMRKEVRKECFELLNAF